ncbi:metalloregulator ArsR/SmtB family transcription factor [Pseudoxanthomonas sp. SL93]|jgi:DNA-binding transcriptional ArsR family regulator|uniref:ArsR/SmtB family transcription factor n=1 Tax=Pseudoxanthomonas sp. SL93 TaxID=2995142 RepID=UPI002271A7CB|nr:metalloregulator ArsR/SmtB family transcription factor [Pseudoxanthomonas sp. SL93]WAC64397.1 metalloregulator ArsR/SmtB family transcription factor [Pseudoxanthomonas sp. SL93]
MPFKQRELEQMRASAAEAAALMRALAHDGRLLVACTLVARGESSAGMLAQEVGLSASALSQHLARMREAGLVESRREAQTLHYRIADPRVSRVVAMLKELYCP